MPTREEIERDAARRRIEKDAAARRAQAPLAVPLPEQQPPPVEFAAPKGDYQAEGEDIEAAFESTKQRLEPLEGEGRLMEAERQRLERLRKSQVTSLQSGAQGALTEDTRFILPPFRPTRIRTLEQPGPATGAPGTPQALSDIELGRAILATGDEARLKELNAESDRREKAKKAEMAALTPEQLAEFATPKVKPEGERFYVSARTGEMRPPTAWEEFKESFAQQPVMTEAAARETAAKIKARSDEIDRRIKAGEEVGLFEFKSPLFSGILSTRDAKGAGTVETPLGVAFRGVWGLMSALAAEGYFRALGYEVDKNGQPLDPDDFGLAVATARRSLGIPDVVTSRQGVGFPTPGMATEGTQRKATPKDPEARRRVSGIEAPSALEDPRGFADGVTRRVARHVASGRGFSDEFFDSPATREFYLKMWGSEDAAWWAGAGFELAIPATPYGAIKTVGTGAKAAAKLAGWGKVVERGAEAVIGAAEAKRAAGAGGGLADVAADAVAAIVPGRASDGRVVRRVAGGVLDEMLLDPAVAAQAKAAIKPTSSSFTQIMDDVGDVLSPGTYRSPWSGAVSRGRGTEASLRAIQESDMSAAAKHFYTQLVRKTPDDLVMVTDNVAVPRANASAALAEANRAKKLALQRDNAALKVFVDKYRGIANGTAGLDRAGPILDSMDKLLATSARRALNVPGERLFLDAAERAKFDKLSEQLAGVINPLLESSLATRSATPETVAAIMGRFGVPKGQATARSLEELESLVGSDYLNRGLIGRGKTVGGVELDAARVRDMLANEVANRAVLSFAPQNARFTRDLTAAQASIRGIEQSLTGLSRVAAMAGDSATAKKARALTGLDRGAPTVATAKAGRDIKAAALTALRGVGQELEAEAKATGSVDKALEQLFIKYDLNPDEAWIKALEGLYGNPELARTVLENAKASNLAALLGDVPTVDALRGVDSLFAGAGKFVGRGNVVADSFGPLTRLGNLNPAIMLTPDYQKALLKVLVEEGVRKSIGPKFKQIDLVESGVDVAINRSLDEVKQLEAASEKLKQLTRAPEFGATSNIPDMMENSARIRVYDPLASIAEKEFAGSAEALVVFAESISPRLRGDILEMGKAALEWVTVGAGRNVANMAKYGYIIPNIPYFPLKTMQPIALSLLTSGLEQTTQAGAQVLRRRLIGGGLYTVDGRYYSPDDLANLSRTAGLGLSSLETQRVGTLAYDILKDAERAATKADKGLAGRVGTELLFELDPLTRSIYQRIAEAVEFNFRQGVFESRLAAGDGISEAADAARRSALDYGEVPGPVREQVGRFVAEAAEYWQLTVELVRRAAQNPQAATVFYKSMMLKQRVTDPYGVHGDESLKSLIVEMPDGTFLSVPGGSGAFSPIQAALATGAAANQSAAVLFRAVSDEGAAKSLVQSVTEGGVELALEIGQQALPTLLAAIEASGAIESTEARKLKRPGVNEDSAFWAAAAAAHAMDPGRDKGIWNAFLTLYRPEYIAAPAGFQAYPGATDERRNFWSKVPPGGMPYLIYGVDKATNEVIYKTFRPSEAGKAQLNLLRKFPPAALPERLGAYYMALTEENPSVKTSPALPRVEGPSDLPKLFLPQVPGAAAERERQARELAGASAAADAPATR
jgi:hypothetical protein